MEWGQDRRGLTWTTNFTELLTKVHSCTTARVKLFMIRAAPLGLEFRVKVDLCCASASAAQQEGVPQQVHRKEGKKRARSEL